LVNLPYAMWVSGSLNIDAAEWVGTAMEHFGAAPKSSTAPTLDLTKLGKLPGNEWLR
jgi:iron complex transport system substrate-binding protein